MISLELQPSERLRPFVELYWYCATADENDDLSVGRIVPDGLMELVFQFAEPVSIQWAGKAAARQPNSVVVLQTRRYIDLMPQASMGMISVRFRPWGAHAFVKSPLHPFADQVVGAQEIWGSAIDRLENDLAESSSISGRVRLVEAFLMRHLAIEPGPGLETLVRAVWAHKGNGQVSALCSELGITERRLQRVCARYIGMPPKQLLRVSRLLRACTVLKCGRWQSLTGVAHDCGYYDQAHLNYDFRALVGLTPLAFHADQAISYFAIE